MFTCHGMHMMTPTGDVQTIGTVSAVAFFLAIRSESIWRTDFAFFTIVARVTWASSVHVMASPCSTTFSIQSLFLIKG